MTLDDLIYKLQALPEELRSREALIFNVDTGDTSDVTDVVWVTVGEDGPDGLGTAITSTITPPGDEITVICCSS
jgi:hypothetical protein